MRKKHWILSACILGCLVGACYGYKAVETGGAPREYNSTDKTVSVIVEHDTVRVSNDSNSEIRFGVVGDTKFHSATIEWCFGMSSCGQILAPHASVRLAYSEISGAEPPETKALLFWWSANPSPAPAYQSLTFTIR